MRELKTLTHLISKMCNLKLPMSVEILLKKATFGMEQKNSMITAFITSQYMSLTRGLITFLTERNQASREVLVGTLANLSTSWRPWDQMSIELIATLSRS